MYIQDLYDVLYKLHLINGFCLSAADRETDNDKRQSLRNWSNILQDAMIRLLAIIILEGQCDE